MADKHTGDEEERATEAYDHILDNLRGILSSTSELTRQEFDRALRSAGSSLDEASEFTRQEIDRAIKAVRKDWQNLMQAADKQKDTFLQSESFRQVANTSLEFLGRLSKSIKDFANVVDEKVDEQLTYHTGEVAGPGKFVCTECGKAMNFKKSGRIPPCSSCKNTSFRREFAA
ncbi:MAG TPA: hypothetical protein VKA68_00525 [bacterium]|nr:hypothetical protein [bacterium]